MTLLGRRRKVIACGSHVHIVAPTKDMADDFIAFTTESRVYHHPWVQPATDPAGYRAYLDRIDGERAFGFFIARNSDDALVGVININDVIRGGFRSGSFGYYGSAAFSGRGYMVEGMGLVLDQAFGPLGLHRIEANVQPGNPASLALIARVGFRKEGFSPAFLQVDGVWCDHERWAILADHWRPAAGPPVRHISQVV